MFLRRVNLFREGNIRAFKFGIYIAATITFIGIFNFLVKTFLDPCCQDHTVGEPLLKISTFLSYIVGIGIIFLVFMVFIKQLFDKFKTRKDIYWKREKESGLNMLFVAILIINFGLLLISHVPVKFIGCTYCETSRDVEVIQDNNNIDLPFFN
jgi:hypothetical protein